MKGLFILLKKKIVKKGTSNYVLIPKDFLDMFNVKLGDYVFLKVDNNTIIIEPEKKEPEIKTR